MDKRVGLSVIFRLSDAEKSRFKPDVRAPILARCARRGARGCRPARARGLLLDLFGAQPPSSLSFAQVWFAVGVAAFCGWFVDRKCVSG